MVTEAATIEDIDTALVYMRRDLRIADEDGNETQATNLRGHIDKLLEKRWALAEDQA